MWIAIWNKDKRFIVLGVFDSLELFEKRVSKKASWADAGDYSKEWDMGEHGRYILSPVRRNFMSNNVLTQ